MFAYCGLVGNPHLTDLNVCSPSNGNQDLAGWIFNLQLLREVGAERWHHQVCFVLSCFLVDRVLAQRAIATKKKQRKGPVWVVCFEGTIVALV